MSGEKAYISVQDQNNWHQQNTTHHIIGVFAPHEVWFENQNLVAFNFKGTIGIQFRAANGI